ncbi:MAG TPA: RIP metalloprotease RseP [Thermodesulfobacteriota bacterium]|nr:RIP metalloprotease RseP [Thermodesulfobacteriota bacterium]
MTVTLIATVIVLGVLIFVHELGHFIMAKKSGVGVLTFSLGFGPKIFGRKVGETQYQISLIPLGGYVKMVGEEPGEKLPPELIPKSFSSQPVGKRLAIVFAGPFFNFLFAVVAFTLIFMVGMPALLPEVGEVKPDFPAFRAGLQKGDLITEVDGAPVQRWEDLAKTIHDSTRQKPLVFTVKRGEKTFQISVTPEITTQKNIFGDDIQIGLVGISPSGNSFTERFGPIKAVSLGLVQSWSFTKLTVISVVKMIEGKVSPKTIGGPILIAQLAGQQAKAGVLSLIFFMAVISINLVILNILPIPVLDGGHIFFFLIEAVIGKPVSLKIRERAQQIGVFVIIFLMLLVFYNDISRIFGPTG